MMADEVGSSRYCLQSGATTVHDFSLSAYTRQSQLDPKGLNERDLSRGCKAMRKTARERNKISESSPANKLGHLASKQ